jgi:hypothetical protein
MLIKFSRTCLVAIAVVAISGCGDKDKKKGESANNSGKPTAGKTAGKPTTAKPTTAKPTTAKPETDKTTGPDKQPTGKTAGDGIEVPGFDGIFVPAGGKGGPPPHGGTSMVVYSYQKARDALAAELDNVLHSAGWKIASKTKSPRGSVRMTVEKNGKKLDVRVAGGGPRAAIIITKPRR